MGPQSIWEITDGLGTPSQSSREINTAPGTVLTAQPGGTGWLKSNIVISVNISERTQLYSEMPKPILNE